jgi:p-aminobenzoyl-glutamate transporter AbgT
VQLHQKYPEINVYVLSLIPLAIMVLIAWIMTKYLEPELKKWLKNVLSLSSRSKLSNYK